MGDPMPFLRTGLSERLKAQLQEFAARHDFRVLYRRYDWNRDTWRSGFPDILDLEERVTAAARNGALTRADVRCIAKWGRHRNPKAIRFPKTAALPLYDDDGVNPDGRLQLDPLMPLRVLLRMKKEGMIAQLGPTYLTKVLRFALPEEYGAIDTRVVRVFGIGDPESAQQHWLSLKARNDGYGWYIAEYQQAWPEAYATWISILRFFALSLNDSGRLCPHPQAFVKSGMRTHGSWACADVEMALFTYASEWLPTKRCRP